jgi:hypothetical protein
MSFHRYNVSFESDILANPGAAKAVSVIKREQDQVV